MSIMVMVAWRCDLCGHVWLAREPDPPALCAKCRKRRWFTGKWDGNVELGDHEGLKIADVEGGELRIVMVEGVGMAVVKAGLPAGTHEHVGLSREKKGADPDGHPPVAAGDYSAMASLWLQFLRPLPRSRRLGVLVKFFMLLPPGYCRDVVWAVTSPRIVKPGAEAIAPEQAVEAIAELWRNEFSSLDESGRLNAFGSFLQNIWNRDWALLAKALEEAQANEAAAQAQKAAMKAREGGGKKSGERPGEAENRSQGTLRVLATSSIIHGDGRRHRFASPVLNWPGPSFSSDLFCFPQDAPIWGKGKMAETWVGNLVPKAAA